MFKVEKLPLETLINLLIDLYDSGIDYVDLSSDNSSPEQDKLIIQTKEDYINPEFSKTIIEDKEEEFSKKPPIIKTKTLTDEDINNLL